MMEPVHNYLSDLDDRQPLRITVRMSMHIARQSASTSALGSDLTTAAAVGLA